MLCLLSRLGLTTLIFVITLNAHVAPPKSTPAASTVKSVEKPAIPDSVGAMKIGESAYIMPYRVLLEMDGRPFVDENAPIGKFEAYGLAPSSSARPHTFQS